MPSGGGCRAEQRRMATLVCLAAAAWLPSACERPPRAEAPDKGTWLASRAALAAVRGGGGGRGQEADIASFFTGVGKAKARAPSGVLSVMGEAAGAPDRAVPAEERPGRERPTARSPRKRGREEGVGDSEDLGEREGARGGEKQGRRSTGSCSASPGPPGLSSGVRPWRGRPAGDSISDRKSDSDSDRSGARVSRGARSLSRQRLADEEGDAGGGEGSAKHKGGRERGATSSPAAARAPLHFPNR